MKVAFKWKALVLSLLVSTAPVSAQTDVTGQYVTNPSFESDNLSTLTAVNNSSDGLRGYTVTAPSGWQVSGTDAVSLIVTADCYTDNNFGQVSTIADGSQAYYLRMGWSTGTTTLSQTLTALPAGRYKLSADIRTAYANSATSTYKLFAGDDGTGGTFGQGSTGCFASMAWTTVQLTFSVASAGDVNVGIEAGWQSGGSCIMIDNVTLQQLSDDDTEPDEPTETDITSVTEGIINGTFVGEEQMTDDLLQMLANFSTYLVNDFQAAAAPNSAGETCGCFKSNSTMQNNEDGVRSNADLSMITAFLCKYGPDWVTLPDGISWSQLQEMALQSLIFAYSTHKANKLKVCAGNNYWGSVSTSDHVWESSLWAMSVAYSAFFQWNRLTTAQKGYVEALLKAECNYELGRTIPTGYNGDTKAEENGWEACVLAATLGLFPDDDLAPQWFERLREFAINSYSHVSDATDNSVIDPDYDTKTVSDLYIGQNLYDDYTLQNHNYFHTSYQNVVIQELGEAALALQLFQTELHGTEKWKTNALMHNNLEVQQEVLNWLALADGELAMPNGNDWSLFLYDQITSYSTNATFLRDADALMLENLAYKMIQARQTTTSDGSWLLRSDIGARRMGVEGHRVMMSWLMHRLHSTADLTPSDFEELRSRYADARIFESQNIVRAYSPSRFTTFSWANGISSYTGYIAANSVDKNKIIVPYKANNTGNFLGWYTVSGKSTNATPVVNGIYQLDGTAWVMNGELNTNDAALNNRFAIYSTPGNAVIYLDYVTANTAATVTKEQGGLTAISVDELTKTARTLYSGDTHRQLDGSTFTTFTADWVNIDNALGIVAHNDKQMAFGDRSNNNSIMTAKLYPAYSSESRTFAAGDVVDARNFVWYSNLSADSTQLMSEQLTVLRDRLPAGWNGVLAADPDGSRYLLLSNFQSVEKAPLNNITTDSGAPVFTVPTTISDSKSTATFTAEPNHSVAQAIRYYIEGSHVEAIERNDTLYLLADTAETNLQVRAGQLAPTSVRATESRPLMAYVRDGLLIVEQADAFPLTEADTLSAGFEDVTADYLQNPSFELDETYGNANGNVTLGSITYNPCYVNEVSAISSSWPNILPVTGWTAQNSLAAASNYCRMYSMPYSASRYCVSPSSVGNYAARTTPMVADDSCGVRTLTVLNSWAAGSNAITQQVTLPAGTYRLLLDMKYECPNQTANTGSVVTTAANTNTSLTGIRIGTTTDYRYPSQRNEWQVVAYDFELTGETPVTVSLGFSTSASVGAANNTLLYIDHIRLLRRPIADAIRNHQADATPTADNATYNLAGQRVSHNYHGTFIRNGRKYIRR